MTGLSAPPPQTKQRRSPGMAFKAASAAVRAVSIVSVAATPSWRRLWAEGWRSFFQPRGREVLAAG